MAQTPGNYPTMNAVVEAAKRAELTHFFGGATIFMIKGRGYDFFGSYDLGYQPKWFNENCVPVARLDKKKAEWHVNYLQATATV
jgi:hypothetical protein